jgi:alpha-glucosidase
MAEWWQRGVIYQVYPRSFADSNGDGVGDLPGIVDRLDYLEWLGVDAIWLSPIFSSPMADFGYDVAGYRDIAPIFGTLADLDRLVDAAHARGIRVILDYVPNHTSDQHPWFTASRSSRDDPRRDWYLWADPRPDGSPPNGWTSMFGGSAWTWDEPTAQYYYHGFLPQQPDLNWRNPEVQEAMLDVLRFWLDRGIDGFRIDVLWLLLKDAAWREDPADRWAGRADLPGIEELVARMRATTDAYDGRVLIGEIYLPVERLVAYYGTPDRPGVHLPYNFGLIHVPWDAGRIRDVIAGYEAALPGHAWPNWVLGNHDQSRIATRVGAAQARVAAMLLLTLRGTPTVYQGDEIGMADVPVPPGRRADPAEPSRDPARSPMRWSPAPNGGFTIGEPWLPMAASDPGRSVEEQRDDPGSMLSLHRRLLALRRAEPALAVGGLELLPAPDGVVAYRRASAGYSLDVVLNLTSHAVEVELPGPPGRRLSASTIPGRAGARIEGRLRLGADEGVVAGPA